MRCRAWSLLAICTILLAGCSVAPTATHQPTTVAHPATNTAPLEGQVYGGQQPVNLSHVYLFALSTGGYGQAATSLLLDTTNTTGDTAEDSQGRYFVTTNTHGGFKMQAGDYACGGPTTGPQQVYLYSGGGDSGFGANSGIGLMAVLGTCVNSAFTGVTTHVQINEVTTIAAAYALAGYATDATDMSGSSTALAATGMANAALSAGNLVGLATGQPLSTTPAGNGTVPVNEIDTLADILASCINSSGPGPGSACSTLFADTTADGTPTGLQPSDTATVAINIAHNPGANVPALYDLATSTAPFQPILTGPSPYNGPNDWTILVTYPAGAGAEAGLMEGGPAIDAYGNVWTLQSAGLAEFSPTGSVLSPASAYSFGGFFANSFAFDDSGNVWAAGGSLSVNEPSTLVELNSSGTIINTITGHSGGIYDPRASRATDRAISGS